jgi:hypothetical protein
MQNTHHVIFKIKDFSWDMVFKSPDRADIELKDLNVDDYINQTGKRVLASLDECRIAIKKEQEKEND